MSSEEHLHRILEAMHGRRIAILGDCMLDRYIWGEVHRISPEAPVPVVEAFEQNHRLGGAANVAANIRALGGQPVLIGVVGDDAEGDCLRRELENAGLASGSTVSLAERPTTVKTRIIARNQQVVRVDFEQTRPLDSKAEGELKDRLNDALNDADGFIVSDYGKGVVTAGVLGFALGEAEKAGVAVSVDPKESHFDLYRRVNVITPNLLEASAALGRKLVTDEEVAAGGAELRDRLDAESVLITRGPHGMTLYESDGSAHFPAAAQEVYDVTGAGDTVVGTFSMAFAAGATRREAAALSNLAASLVVGEVGTTVAGNAALREVITARQRREV